MSVAKIRFDVGTGDDRKSYTFDEGDLLNTEAMAIERATDLPVLRILKGLQTGWLISYTAIVWILRRREEPYLEFDEVQFKVSDLGIPEDADEEPAVPKEDAPDNPPEPN